MTAIAQALGEVLLHWEKNNLGYGVEIPIFRQILISRLYYVGIKGFAGHIWKSKPLEKTVV